MTTRTAKLTSRACRRVRALAGHQSPHDGYAWVVTCGHMTPTAFWTEAEARAFCRSHRLAII